MVALGKPTVRKAQLLGGYRVTEKRMPVAERRQETRARRASFLRWGARDNWPDTGPGAWTRKGADAVR